MLLTIIDLVLALASGLLGAAAVSWLWYHHARRQTNVTARRTSPPDAAVRLQRLATQATMDFAIRLNELATQVAFDVDEHNSQIEEINDELTSSKNQDSTTILDVVVKLVGANQHMQEKLTATEEKLREQSDRMQTLLAETRTDALTLLANRRAFDDELGIRAAEFRRQGRTFSLTMLDIDHFKNFNDAYGHKAGDEVLRTLAKVLRRKMREVDLVARYGGDEFAVIHPGANLANAYELAQRACAAIEKHAFVYDGQTLGVTVSFGVAEKLDSESASETFKRADRAMYASKQDGRNCVHFHDGTALRRVAANMEPDLTPADMNLQARSASEVNRSTVEGKSMPLPSKEDAMKVAAEDGQCSSRAEGIDELAASWSLPGRTHFCQQVRTRMAEWKRGGPAFSIALIEAGEHRTSDGHRHQSAQQSASRMTARFLLATVREMDVLGSYTADCFALMMPAAGVADAIRVADRQLDLLLQHVSLASGKQPPFRLSVGVVQAIEADDATSILKRAEMALDAANRQGGNRVYCHNGERILPGSAVLEMETTGYPG